MIQRLNDKNVDIVSTIKISKVDIMLKISPKDQFVVSKQALEEVLKNYNITNFEYEIPEGGVSNINLIIKIEEVKKYVLRILRKNKKTIDEISLEIDYQNFLCDNLLPIAQTVKNSEGLYVTLFKENETVWQCVLIEYIQGTNPKITDFSENIDFLKTLAYQNADLYNVTIKYNGKYTKESLTSLSQTSSAKIIENLIKDINLDELKNYNLVGIINNRNELYSNLTRLDISYSLIHDDINITNVLMHNGQISAILDFDELYYGPVISCAVNTAFEFVRFRNDPNVVFEYLRYFQERFKLKTDDLLIIKNLLLLRNLMFIVYLTRFHGEDFPHLATHLDLIDKIKSL